MLEIAVKIILGFVFLIIFIQDYKDRKVTWALFPTVAICAAILFSTNSIVELFYISVIYNLLFVSILLGVIFIYAKLKLKTHINTVIGIGDVLLFLGLCFTFSTVSFIFIFVCSLIFSLILHLSLTKKQNHSTVPLAGYMSLFFGVVFLGSWLGVIDAVYQI
ncbi:general secretion pathway protein [Flavobacteriaceae bacterium MHTCC 0001]